MNKKAYIKIIMIFFLIGISGCSKSAIIKLKNNQKYMGEIIGGTQDTLFISPNEKTNIPIFKDSIIDINHPGTALSTGGGILFLLSSVSYYFTYKGLNRLSTLDGGFNSAKITLTAIYGLELIGSGVMIYKGIKNWKNSKERMNLPIVSIGIEPNALSAMYTIKF